jgi:hypothetical protein
MKQKDEFLTLKADYAEQKANLKSITRESERASKKIKDLEESIASL